MARHPIRPAVESPTTCAGHAPRPDPPKVTVVDAQPAMILSAGRACFEAYVQSRAASRRELGHPAPIIDSWEVLPNEHRSAWDSVARAALILS